jgi:tripartite-type tricarboxylate transporter receptor subunit TctC
MIQIIIFLLAFLSAPAYADPYKEIPKTVQYIIPYGPGGIADLQFRHFEQYLATKGVRLIGIYRAGGNSSIAAQELMSSPKDGSVIMLNSTSNSWLAEQRLGKKVIDPITTTGGNANMVITYTGSKYEKYDDFIKALKAGDPDIKIGWHAVANLLNIQQLAEKVGAPMPLTVPYKTSTDSSREVAGKHLSVAFVPVTTARPLIEAGLVKVIFGFSPGDTDFLPADMVDIKDRIPSWRHGELFFVGLPPGTDERVFKAWSAIFKEYLNSKETDEAFKKNAFARDIGGPEYVNDVISKQAAGLKKYHVDIK